MKFCKQIGMGIILFIIILSITQCQPKPFEFHKASHPNIEYTGRIDFSNPEKPKLSGAASYIQITFTGTHCTVYFKDQYLYQNHNYMTAILDDEYLGRFQIERRKQTYDLAKDLENKEHTLLLCKATESQIGYVEFIGISCGDLLPVEDIRTRKIEFIGNSITCGMGLDFTDLPCDSGEWYDQHNAYLAYGPIIAQQLDSDWLLSSSSGIGVYRNWNSPGPTMPQVYHNLFLDEDTTLKWQPGTYNPDLISICLGTNDFSEGDGTYDRADVDSVQFVRKYINFIIMIQNLHPNSTICCVNSPMKQGKEKTRLGNFIKASIRQIKRKGTHQNIHFFEFTNAYNNGCTTHPDMEDHQQMAEELIPFYKKVMDW